MSKQQLIAGRNPVLELLRSDSEVEKVLISKNASGEVIKEIIQLCRDKEVYYQFVPEIKINSLSKANHQGILAFTALIEYQNIQKIIDFVFEKGENPLLLILARDRPRLVGTLQAVSDGTSQVCVARPWLRLPASALLRRQRLRRAVRSIQAAFSR